MYVFLCLLRLNYGQLDLMVPFSAPTLCWWAFTMIESINRGWGVKHMFCITFNFQIRPCEWEVPMKPLGGSHLGNQE